MTLVYATSNYNNAAEHKGENIELQYASPPKKKKKNSILNLLF